MNTKKVFYGLLAVAFLAMTAVSTTTIDTDSLEDAPSIEKSRIRKL
ncbi:hypothetical protein HME9304_03060 [Flagellimonas maritima]|uniref:Uncharacterized protein n=1 Tax=Flagellimonas maritima TaxID=1383885 RepID=A0A2Z4LXD3_9FLAO|nr:hypothetical protein [Allomuricauda aurantiaca]AWX46028.1 hypothetical protein HME9304_03060 [Allomuricauda aurantiaca]